MKTLFLAFLLSLSSIVFSQTYDIKALKVETLERAMEGYFIISDSTVVLIMGADSTKKEKYNIISKQDNVIKCNKGSEFCTLKIVPKKGKNSGQKYDTIIEMDAPFSGTSRITMFYYCIKRI